MNSTSELTRETELVFQRLLDLPPTLALFVPVAVALLVLFLVLYFRQQEPLSELLRTLFLPPAVTQILNVIWSVGVMLCVAVLAVLVVLALVLDQPELLGMAPLPLLILGVPLLAYAVLMGLLTTLAIILRQPHTLIPLAGVLAGSVLFLALAFAFQPLLGWLVVLVPVVLLALFYIGMMYRQDAHSVHPLWATFLGLLRCAVYFILAWVFLLPGYQTYDTRETHSKTLVLFDVSDSMLNKEMVGQQSSKEVSRQDKIVSFLTNTKEGTEGGKRDFLQRVQEKSPVTAFRFGALVDDFNVLQFAKGNQLSSAEWNTWLHPDAAKAEAPKMIGGKALTEEEQRTLTIKLADLYRDLKGGTNISGSALQALLQESGHLIQAIVIFSDGQSNLGSSDTYRELLARAANPKRPIHIITVGVGQYRQPISLAVQDIQAPQQARPDDKFPLRVSVVGEGLPNENFTVNLEITRVKKDGDKWEPVAGFKKVLTEKGKLADRGERQYGEAAFDIDLRDLSSIAPNDESQDDKLEGYWQFRALVPPNAREIKHEVHESKRPARVLVQKRKLRILLFAGGPSREYQFVRTLLFREVQEKRIDMSVYLQTGANDNVDQDVEKDKLLTQFPTRLAHASAADPSPALNDFDVIIAFDPDWTELSPEQMKLLNKWVGGSSAGGLIFVAGPVNSYQLARPGGRKIDELTSLIPVQLEDNRLVGFGIGHDASRPYTLNFSEAAREFSFLNISEDAKKPLEGWTEFFWDGETAPPPGKDVAPTRGFFNYYPVKKLKPAANVLATFAGPIHAQITEGSGLGEQPFIAVMPYGPGKTIYLGSPEFWRLRQYDEQFHQRFWIKTIRYAGSGNLSKLNKYGTILMAQQSGTGPIKIEAQILGENLLPLPHEIKPTVLVKKQGVAEGSLDRNMPKEFQLQAKAADSDWNGWFSGTFKAFSPGDYTLTIPIPGVPGKALTHDIRIYQPDPEMENRRPNPGYLYQLATSAQPVLARLERQTREEMLTILRPPVDDKGKTQEISSGEDQVRLYFPLEYAEKIPELLVEVPPNRESIKGTLRDLWDQGFGGDTIAVYWIFQSVLALLVFLSAGVLISALVGRDVFQSVVAGVVLGCAVLGILALVIVNTSLAGSDVEWLRVPLQASGYWLLLVVPPGLGLLMAAILGTMRQYLTALVLATVSLGFALGIFAVDQTFRPEWEVFPLEMSYVLGAIVGLLAIEWLTRKLLRLA